jgi:hypothetical protein
MIRASGVHRICTHRLTDNTVQLNNSLALLEEKVQKKGLIFNLDDIETYTTTQGIMTVAKDFISEKDKYEAWIKDELPAGAKTYMKELWLQNNYNFVEFSLNEEGYATRKGKIVEERAIKLIAQYYNLDIVKHEGRLEIDFLTGECDVLYNNGVNNVIRDNKSPISWSTFKNKTGITSDYYWQLIAYCYLYYATEAYLDYTFMPTPIEILDDVKDVLGEEEYQAHLLMNASIEDLEISQRIKTYKLNTDIQSEIEFMKSRIVKCKNYYDTLDYERCMNVKVDEV